MAIGHRTSASLSIVCPATILALSAFATQVSGNSFCKECQKGFAGKDCDETFEEYLGGQLTAKWVYLSALSVVVALWSIYLLIKSVSRTQTMILVLIIGGCIAAFLNCIARNVEFEQNFFSVFTYRLMIALWAAAYTVLILLWAKLTDRFRDPFITSRTRRILLLSCTVVYTLIATTLRCVQVYSSVSVGGVLHVFDVAYFLIIACSFLFYGYLIHSEAKSMQDYQKLSRFLLGAATVSFLYLIVQALYTFSDAEYCPYPYLIMTTFTRTLEFAIMITVLFTFTVAHATRGSRYSSEGQQLQVLQNSSEGHRGAVKV